MKRNYVILHGIVHVVSGFSLYFMFYRGNLYCFLTGKECFGCLARWCTYVGLQLYLLLTNVILCSRLCVAVLVRPADWHANAVMGQHLFIRIHREVSTVKSKWLKISRLSKKKMVEALHTM